ncbi:hypothetical protein [Pseudomonas cedrina]|uniref:hypothetical protein n=1 Tax=Pseudomonas cedrina TaxID=651740 RepID=UPI0026B5FD38
MTSALFKDGFPSAHRTTRQRLESSIDLQRLFFAIDTDPALIGAAVVYIDEEFSVVTLRDFQAVCSVQPKKVVQRGDYVYWPGSHGSQRHSVFYRHW